MAGGQGGGGAAGGADSITGAGGAGSPGATNPLILGGGGGGGGAGVAGGDGGTGLDGNGASTIPGGAGGLTASNPSTNGGSGSNGAQSGSGGGGGAHAVTGTSFDTRPDMPQGGAGGAGGNAVGGTGGGGGGGAGGYGAVATGSGQTSYTGGGYFSGGDGGAGGSGFNGGSGGSGGVGAYFAGSGNTVYLGPADVSGGRGGAGGAANGGVTGSAGLGGAALVFASGNQTIYFGFGNIYGGLSGDGISRANAITIAGGNNKLYLGLGNVFGNVALTGLTEIYSGFNQLFQGTFSDLTGNTSLKIYNGLTLVNDSTYTGTTTVVSDTLRLGNGGLTGRLSDQSAINLSSATLAINHSNAIIVGSSISGNGNLIQEGTGTTTLSSINSYDGGTTFSSGTLAVSADNNLGASTGGLTFNGGTLSTTASFATARAVTITAGGVFAEAGGTTLTLNGTITGAAPLVQAGPGTLSLAADNTSFTGSTTISGGTLALAGAGSIASSSGIQNNSVFDISGLTGSGATVQAYSGAGQTVLGAKNLTVQNGGVVDGVISGVGGSLTITGGTLSLTAVDTYTGTTMISGGTLALTGAGSIAASSKVINDTIFDISGVTATSSSTVSLAGTKAYAEVTLGTKNLSLTNAADTFEGKITGTGGLSVIGGTEVLTGESDYSGATFIGAGATLQFGTGGASGTINAASTLTTKGTLAFNHSDSLVFGNTITGSGGLTHTGTGTLTLTGTSSYTGATTVSGGTMLVNGSISSSATTVQTGSTLGGSGTTGAVTVVSGGTLSPGNSPGLLNTGNLALANGAIYIEQIGGTKVGTQYDQTNVTGTVNLNSGGAASGATLSVSAVNGFTPAAGQSYVIINNDGNDVVQGTFAGLAEGATVTVNGVNLIISYRGGDGNDVTLTDPLPPPSGPTAVSDTASATFGTALIKAAPGVLANDSGSGSALTVTAVNGQMAAVGKAVAGAYGSLTLNGDGSYAYTPDATKTVFTTSVVDHFTYTDTANGLTSTANLDITVSAPPASTLALFGTVVTNSASQTGSVYALYEALLGRAPDALGLEGFSASLQAGGKLTDVAAAILSSTEHGPAITDPTTYVQSLYANALHRGADGGGLSYYTNELNAGVSQATVAVQIASSAEAQQVNAPAFSTGVFVTDTIDAAVARLYYGVLGRTPDAGGLANFEAQIKQLAATGGVAGAIQGLASVANVMLSSSEYGQAHAGQTSAAFVDSLYVGALGRHADAGGSSFYVNELAQGVSQAQVALQIAQSSEAQVHLVGHIELGWHLA